MTIEPTVTLWEGFAALPLILIALVLRPWRMLAHVPLRDPWLATLILLPTIWSLPLRLHDGLQLQWSGACLVELCLGWPLAIPTLAFVGVLTGLISQAPWPVILDLTLWQGLVPASLFLLVGALQRRYLPHQVFVYVLGRGFFGTVLAVFAASALSHVAGHTLPQVTTELAWVAQWLMAWGDAFITGMLAAIFVAFRPQWLATWSDRIYLHPPKSPDHRGDDANF